MLQSQPGFDTAARVRRTLRLVARRLGTWFVVLALVLSTGGHWAVLQLGAWTGMFVRFAQEDSVAVALTKTFDGQHPCRFCQLVKQGRSEERQRHQPSAAPRLDLFLSVPASVLVLPAAANAQAQSSWIRFAPQRGQSPPVPPPRPA